MPPISPPPKTTRSSKLVLTDPPPLNAFGPYFTHHFSSLNISFILHPSESACRRRSYYSNYINTTHTDLRDDHVFLVPTHTLPVRQKQTTGGGISAVFLVKKAVFPFETQARATFIKKRPSQVRLAFCYCSHYYY